MSLHVLSPSPTSSGRGSGSHRRTPGHPREGGAGGKRHLRRGGRPLCPLRPSRPQAEPSLAEPALPAAADKCAQRHLHSAQAGRAHAWACSGTCRGRLLQPVGQMGKLRHGSASHPRPGRAAWVLPAWGGGCRQRMQLVPLSSANPKIQVLLSDASPQQHLGPGGKATRGPSKKQGTGALIARDLPWSLQLHRPSRQDPAHPSPDHPAPSLSGCQLGSWLHPWKTQPPEPPRPRGPLRRRDPSPAQVTPGRRVPPWQGMCRQGPSRQGCLLCPKPSPYLCRYLNDSLLYCSGSPGGEEPSSHPAWHLQHHAPALLEHQNQWLPTIYRGWTR